MKQGRLTYYDTGKLRCKICGQIEYIPARSNPLDVVMAEEALEKSHECNKYKELSPRTRVLDGNLPILRARRVLGFVN